MSGHWKIWIDTGGTFTDCIGVSPSGEMKRLKVLSNSALRGKIIAQPAPDTLIVQLTWPVKKAIFRNYEVKILGSNVRMLLKTVDFEKNQLQLQQPLLKNFVNRTLEITSNEEVPVLAARLTTETPLDQPFPSIEMKLGSTRGTNAILERKGAKTALLVTRGFKDLLVIGNQQRPDLFALNIRKEAPLYHTVLEADERLDASGEVVVPLTKAEIKRLAEALTKKKIASVAVAFLNSYKNPRHEQIMCDALQDAGFPYVSASSALSKQVKILQRAETTVANAYLAPIIREYLARIRSGLTGATLKIMTSSGGLVDAQDFHPKDSLLSGPAGGVVGAAAAASLSGHDRVITFDMGGTSTDVSLYNGKFDYRYESSVAGLKILSPSLAIETIAAGGGSICDFDGYRLTVGPHSAGASPGPACYGAGGPLTITDVNLLLGRVDKEKFSIPLQDQEAENALQALLNKIKKSTGKNPGREQVLESLTQIANEKMAEAIKKVSVQNGFDPADFTLLSFGGAGGQHAIALAVILGMKQVVIPYDAGLLSAYGIGHASIEQFEERLVLQNLSSVLPHLESWYAELYERGKQFLHHTHPQEEVTLEKKLIFLRFQGQESTIELEYTAAPDVFSAFRKKYESIFGHWLNDREIELESIRAIVSIRGFTPVRKNISSSRFKPAPRKTQRVFTEGRWKEIAFHTWEDLTAGAEIQGPALVTSNNSTVAVEEGWNFFLDGNNNALLTRIGKTAARARSFGKEALLELFTNRFTSVAQEMGALLQRTSFSVNVKERLDFSCALLDRHGYLVVNAPHIPVHLGSMGVCVREVLNVLPVREGDVVITNHPAFGGSHLPDVTLIKGVFVDSKLVGYVANRAHHAEIGGKKPGSMPSDATCLEEEGVIIPPAYLMRDGVVHWDEIRKLFIQSKHPTRLWHENFADLNAALAAVNFGEAALRQLCAQYGRSAVSDYMARLRNYSAQLLKERIEHLSGRKLLATERLDDGTRLNVTIMRKAPGLIFDFTGTSPVHAGNLNATRAIVQSALLYVLRLLVNKPIPMNEGLLENVKIVLPACCLDPFSNTDLKTSGADLPAVVGGNTEVSQRLTDTLLKAFGLAACSQGTMNNFLFGNRQFGYYETIGGGTGAGPGFNGSDAVHQHMTNTRITDAELLELRYPVRLLRFEIRKNSGGRGKWSGGNGIVREILFNTTVEVNLLSQHRKEVPYGMKGGRPGKKGNQKIIRADGSVELLKGMDSITAEPGDRLIIQTPGGGGWGKHP